MIGLDTPILLRLLRGDPRAREWLREWEGEELATTEWNLLELEALARADPNPGRERRRAALENLRRRITVLPVDDRATSRLSTVSVAPRSPSELAQLAAIATAESRGCRVWVSEGKAARAPSHWKVSVRSVR